MILRRTRSRRQTSVARRLQAAPAPAFMPAAGIVRRLPRLIAIQRQGALLRPSPLSELVEGEVCSLNLMNGCPLQCPLCYARVYPNYPGDNVVYWYPGTAERLHNELAQRSRMPRAVHLCSSTDPFPPYLEIQREVADVIEVLAKFNVEAWFQSRGNIRPFLMDALEKYRERVRVTVALNTVDNRLRRTLEPLAAPPAQRLRQLRRLRDCGVAVQASIDPLIPTVTDSRTNLEPLLDQLAEAGVAHVSAAYLFLRRGMDEILECEFGPLDLADQILDAYRNGPVLAMGGIAPARHLPRIYRQRGYALLAALASKRGITISVCGLTNPDFRPARPPPALRREPTYRQLELL